MSEINYFMDELLDYEMEVDDEELDNEILQLSFENVDSNVVEDVPKIKLKELTPTFPMDVKEDPSSNEEKQKSDQPTSSLISSEKLESIEQVQLIRLPMIVKEDPSSNEEEQKSDESTSFLVSSERSESVEQVPLPLDVKEDPSTNDEKQKSDKPTSSLISSEASSSTTLFPFNLHNSKEFWKLTYATINKVMKNNVVPTPATEVAQAEKVEDLSSIYGKTRVLSKLTKIADNVSSLTINESNNDLNGIEIDPVDSIVNEQKHPQKQMPPQSRPQYKNLHTTSIPMKINKQKPLQYDSQNTTRHSSSENSKETAGKRYPDSRRATSTNSQALGESMEPKSDQNYETVFHSKRDIPSLLSIKVLPAIESDQTRPVINNSNNFTTTASPFIITALNGAQSSRKVLINPSFKGFAAKANPSDANIVPIESRDQSMYVRESTKRNFTDEDLHNKVRKKHRTITYEADHSEVVIQAHDCANGLEDDNQSDELNQYRMKVEKQKLTREEFQRKKELRFQEVGVEVDAYNEDL